MENTVVEQWVLTYICPELAARGALPAEAAAAIEAAASPGTPPERRKLVADQLRDESWSLDPVDREIVWLLARVLYPRSRWSLDPVSLPDRLIDALGLRRVTMLARADEAVLAELVRHHPRIAAMSAALDAIARVQAELARGWTPESQRLAWAAAQLADTADLSVVFDTDKDGVRLLILDAPEVLLDVPYRTGIDQAGYRVWPLNLRP